MGGAANDRHPRLLGVRARLSTALVRDAEIGTFQDAFLISAIATILAIRLELWATNYPEIGGGGLHIAHLLWGGLFMVIAIGLLLSFVGRGVRLPAAIIGGIGFGFFIDELGKFVTEDNNYFFKPTAGIIYLIFIALYLLSRATRGYRGVTPREYLVNAVDALTEAARRRLDAAGKRRAIELLEKADPADPLTHQVRALLAGIDALPERPPGLPSRIARTATERYRSIVEQRWFGWLIGTVFILWALSSLLTAGFLAFSVALEVGGAGGPISLGQDEGNAVSFINLASVAASTLAGSLVIAGVWRLRQRRSVAAYTMFERALLVEIFVGQFFAFVESQFSAVFFLILNVALLVTVRLMIRGDGGREPQVGSPAAVGARP